jgi:AcrR family transcriptional regulator
MVEVVAENGAGSVTVAHVVERAGVSRRTFYELFEDREECFLAALDDAIERAGRCVLDAYDPQARWVQRVRTALIAFLQFLDGEHGTGRLLIVGSLGAGAGALERRRIVLAQIVAAIDMGRAESKNGQGLPPLTGEGVIGGVLSVLHSRLVQSDPGSLVELTGPLMGMIVLPYLGAAAARRELERPAPTVKRRSSPSDASSALRELQMRLTYRTVRVLLAVAASPGASNRMIGDAAGVADQGQISKLLSRLEKLRLVTNTGLGPGAGAPNAWTLTPHGQHVSTALATHAHT